MTLARARELCGPDERSFGEIGITEVEAPTGPAWGEPAFGKAAITIACDMAKNFRIESAN